MVKVSRIYFTMLNTQNNRVNIFLAVPEAYKDLVRSEYNIHSINRISVAQPLPNQHLLCGAANRLHHHLGECIPSQVFRLLRHRRQYCI